MTAWLPLRSESLEVYIVKCHSVYELSHGNDHSSYGIYRPKDQARQVREHWPRDQVYACPDIYNPLLKNPQHGEYAALDWVIIATEVGIVKALERSGSSGENFVMSVTDFKIEEPALMRRMMEIKRGTITTRWNMSKL